MSDFSLFSLFTAGLALASSVAAYTKPVGDAPKGNPISAPGLDTVVVAGSPYTITWEPTTAGTVTLVLLKGPSSNAEPQYAIAEEIENDGTYVWTPKKDLEPTEGAEGYGIQLISDKNGQYQYTTQFGLQNKHYDADSAASASSSSSSAKATSSSAAAPGGYGDHGDHGGAHGGWGHGGHNVHGGYTHSAGPTGTASSMISSYTHKANGTVTSGVATSTGGSGWMTQNVTMIAPTGYSTSKASMPSSSAGGYGPSASVSTPAGPQTTNNAASGLVASFSGLVFVAGAAVLAI